MSHSHSSGSSNNIVGVHYRVGKKIGEGSFGVIFEGPSLSRALAYSYRGRYSLDWIVGVNLLNSQTVAIKFVSTPFPALLLVMVVLEGLVGALGVLVKWFSVLGDSCVRMYR